jgi:hypothetical protein
MLWNTVLTGVVLLFSHSLQVGDEAPDEGVSALAPVQRPVPVMVPDGGTVIIGGLPPFKVGPPR